MTRERFLALQSKLRATGALSPREWATVTQWLNDTWLATDRARIVALRGSVHKEITHD